MKNIEKFMLITGVGALGIAGIIMAVTVKRCEHHSGVCEKAGKSLDERLRESKIALDKATAHVQSVFEHIKNRKS